MVHRVSCLSEISLDKVIEECQLLCVERLSGRVCLPYVAGDIGTHAGGAYAL